MMMTMTSVAGTPVFVFRDAEHLGEALAREVLDGVAATPPGRRYLLGCPGGRSLRSTYQALARLVPADADLRRLVIVMMDEYVVETADGPRRIDPSAHCSCAGFAARGLERAHQRRRDSWPGNPGRARLGARSPPIPPHTTASSRRPGVSTSSWPPVERVTGTSPSWLRVVRRTVVPRSWIWLSRRAVTTWPPSPEFASLDDVPRLGVSVGLGTIARLSRSVAMVLTGASKRVSAARILDTPDFDTSWPATFIHRCPGARILLDAEAAGEG